MNKMASFNSHTQTGYAELDEKGSFSKNPDLMAMTFSHLKNDASYRCLLNAALTCKDFRDAALDALWEKLRSFVCLY